MAQEKEYICTLNKDLNQCPHFDGEQHCNLPENPCGMLRIQNNLKKYIREVRWYEKYYKK